MKPDRHLAASVVLATGCWIVWESPAVAAAALVGGTVVDVDHLLEFRLNRAGRFTVRRFVRLCNEYRLAKLHLVLHSLEWILPFTAWAFWFGGAPWARAAALGLVLHMAMDFVGNGMRAGAYFFLYRSAYGFDSRKLVVRLPNEALAYWGSFKDYMKRKPRRRSPRKN